jgi:prepilin-type N-terminal cleavage/methylation domain-containing protein/prepilin-type processing-associated H-X9-DG protein
VAFSYVMNGSGAGFSSREKRDGRRKEMGKRERGGFTLIELLVVIAIIAILAAILFPVFARAREQAKRSACTSNLRQLAMALHMYAQDYDELFPTGWSAVSGCPPAVAAQWTQGNPKLRFTQALFPYVKNWQIFYCSSVEICAAWDPTLSATPANWAAGNIGYYYWSYLGCNADIGGNTSPFMAWRRVLAECVDAPCDCWLMSDPFKQGKIFPHGFAHASMLNVLFLDGHMKPMKGRPMDLFR